MSSPNIPTRAEYDALTPYAQGYATYMYAEHQGADIPKTNPYSPDSREYKTWARGNFQAMLNVQDEEG